MAEAQTRMHQEAVGDVKTRVTLFLNFPAEFNLEELKTSLREYQTAWMRLKSAEAKRPTEAGA